MKNTKYQFITINWYNVGDSEVEIISEKKLKVFLDELEGDDEAVQSFGKGWKGIDFKEETYIWKKIS